MFGDLPHFKIAAQGGHTETVVALLAGGATVEAKTLKGFTALYKAAQKGHTETVVALLAGQASLEAETVQ